MSDATEQPQPPRMTINPSWIPVIILVAINFGFIAIRYNAIEDHGVRIKTLEAKDARNDVIQAETKLELKSINEKLDSLNKSSEEIRRALYRPVGLTDPMPQAAYPDRRAGTPTP